MFLASLLALLTSQISSGSFFCIKNLDLTSGELTITAGDHMPKIAAGNDLNSSQLTREGTLSDGYGLSADGRKEKLRISEALLQSPSSYLLGVQVLQHPVLPTPIAEAFGGKSNISYLHTDYSGMGKGVSYCKMPSCSAVPPPPPVTPMYSRSPQASLNPTFEIIGAGLISNEVTRATWQEAPTAAGSGDVNWSQLPREGFVSAYCAAQGDGRLEKCRLSGAQPQSLRGSFLWNRLLQQLKLSADSTESFKGKSIAVFISMQNPAGKDTGLRLCEVPFCSSTPPPPPVTPVSPERK